MLSIINEYLKSFISFKNILENDGYYLDSSILFIFFI